MLGRWRCTGALESPAGKVRPLRPPANTILLPLSASALPVASAPSSLSPMLKSHPHARFFHSTPSCSGSQGVSASTFYAITAMAAQAVGQAPVESFFDLQRRNE